MSLRAHQVLTVVAVTVALASASGVVFAESPQPSLPMSCSSGDIVVAKGSNTFACVSPQEVLRVRGCSDDDFVVVDSNGRLECMRPSSTSWGVRALLPDCSSGEMLISEGFGRWKCVDPPT